VTATAAGTPTEPQTKLAFGFVTTLFFIWGAVTSVNDVMIPAVKSVFALSDTEAFLTQFAFFLAYGVVSLPAAALAGRLGSARTIVTALGVMILGCLLMPVATTLHAYPVVLVALFVIASGITLLQVSANPLSASLGPASRTHFRLVFSQAFNSVGTVVGPFLAAHTLLQGGLFDGGTPTPAKIASSLHRIDIAYEVIAAIILALALLLFRVRRLLDASASPDTRLGDGALSAFRSRWALLGAVAIFLYVGAEVAIGSAMTNFLEQPDIMAVAPVVAGSLVSLYWLGALVGRFLGSAALTRLPAATLLAGAAFAAAAACLVVFAVSGPAAGVVALAIGLFNAIMFPVIFTLTMERSTASTPATVGLLCTAVVGGALVPLVFARVADLTSRSTAFLVPLACYLLIAGFALAARRAPLARRDVEEAPALAH
jgi:FHS family L-fucose permease-like MFS transporter